MMQCAGAGRIGAALTLQDVVTAVFIGKKLPHDLFLAGLEECLAK